MNYRQKNSALAVVAGLGLLLAGCEGGRGDDSTSVGARAVGLLPVEDGRGIQATVNDQTHAYRGDMRLTVAGNARNLQVVSQSADTDSWAIQGLTPQTGEYRCDDGSLRITLARAGQPTLSTASGGSCVLTVSQADARRIAGTFSGVLAAAGGPGQVLNDGRFQFELVHVIPDTDADGIADADDNCPFDANPDQADSNGNGVGNACSAAEE